MLWRLECKHSGRGQQFEGDFDQALGEATRQCTRDTCRWVLWALPENVRMAEVNRRGCLWVKHKLTGEEVTTLMRRHHMTIAALSFRMAITQKRIRQAREKGLSDPYAVRDWIEAITGDDVGPLPERYRINRYSEEAICGFCGCPLHVGDMAYEYVNEAFCSVRCCRKSRNWGRGGFVMPKLTAEQFAAFNDACQVIDKARADEIRRLMNWKHGGCLAAGSTRPDIADVTEAEDQAVRRLWHTLPGASSWMTCLYMLVNQ